MSAEIVHCPEHGTACAGDACCCADKHQPPLSEDESPRELQVGDRLTGRPCVVTIQNIYKSTAWGRCETCGEPHCVDRHLYEAGRGPWRPSQSGRSGLVDN